VFVRDRQTDRIFTLCPSCECAWRHPADAAAVDYVVPLWEMAPGGIALPTRDEIASAGLGSFIEEELSDEEQWISSQAGAEEDQGRLGSDDEMGREKDAAP
jgi:hypothetical protein